MNIKDSIQYISHNNVNTDNKYETIVNFLLDYWIIAIAVLIFILIGFIPSLRDGFLHLINLIRKIFKNGRKDFKINFKGEEIVFEYKTRSALFDIVKINATTHLLGVSSEYIWINKYYPGYHMVMQSLSKIKVDDNRNLYFDTLKLENEKGNLKYIYFDISSFFNDSGCTTTDMNSFAISKIKELNKNKD